VYRRYAEAKSRHIAFMSHEIRNPVNGILASVEAIDEMLPVLQMHRARMGMDGGGEAATFAENSDITEVEDLVRTTLACTEHLRWGCTRAVQVLNPVDP
jgi:signal transduction histidine kinase